MKFDQQGQDEARLDLTPMIDCIFQLVLFFLVTSTFIKMEQDRSVELPTAGKTDVQNVVSDPIVISVRYLPGGGASFHVVAQQQEAMRLGELTRLLSLAAGRNSQQAVNIRGDRNVRFQHVAEVLDC